MDNQELAQKLFPNIKLTIEDIEKKYPPRDLPANAPVTRVAPSPTGFMHIGGIFAALISERFSHQQNGVFYLRIEDTDKKREVAGAVE
ncbi:MAG: glutamate--tRNA ligase family protein, partial [Patescibacteria group bacterium]